MAATTISPAVQVKEFDRFDNLMIADLAGPTGRFRTCLPDGICLAKFGNATTRLSGATSENVWFIESEVHKRPTSFLLLDVSWRSRCTECSWAFQPESQVSWKRTDGSFGPLSFEKKKSRRQS